MAGMLARECSRDINRWVGHGRRGRRHGSLVLGRRAALVVAEVAYFTLDAVGGGMRRGQNIERTSGLAGAPSLAGPPLVAGHMAASAVEAGVVDLAPLALLLLLCRVLIVVVRGVGVGVEVRGRRAGVGGGMGIGVSRIVCIRRHGRNESGTLGNASVGREESESQGRAGGSILGVCEAPKQAPPPPPTAHTKSLQIPSKYSKFTRSSVRTCRASLRASAAGTAAATWSPACPVCHLYFAF